MQSRQVSNFKINKMTKAQYSGIVPSQDEVYITTDEADAVLSVNGILPNAQGNVTLNIPSAVTESTVAGWGFTKNEGTVTSVNGNTPDGSGNVAITIPTVPTNVSAFTNDAGYITSSAISNLADTTLSNLSTTASPNFDGQFVDTDKTINNNLNTAIGGYGYDLSSYLPNDGHNYELYVHVSSIFGSNSAYCAVYSDIYTLADTTGSYTQVYVSTNSRVSTNDFTVPIGTHRVIYYKIGGSAFGSLYIRLNGYRRIGTNS